MKTTSCLALALGATLLLSIAGARADVIYFGLQNIAIPTDFNGVYVNLQTGVVAAPTFGGSPNWDINPFFGGAGVANSPRFQPVRTGTGNQDPIVNVGFGGTVNGGLFYSTGYGGSQNGHLGSNANQFQPGQQGYVGYQYSPSGTAYSGWMRVIFTAAQPGGTLLDWAYDDTAGNSIAAGNIQQAAPASGVSLVTLTAAAGEAPVLGTNLTDVGGGNVTAVEKNGAGVWSLGQQSYTGSTAINTGTLAVGANGGKLAGTSGIVVNNTGTLLLVTATVAGAEGPADQKARNEAGGQFNTAYFQKQLRSMRMNGDMPVTTNGSGDRPLAIHLDFDVNLPTAQFLDRINNTAGVMIDGGGRFNTNGLSEGTRPSSAMTMDGVVGMGALTLSNTSSSLRAMMDFLTGANGSSLVFNSFAGGSGAFLDILNWTGSGSIDNGAPGNDRLLFASIGGFNAGDLSNVRFFDDTNALISAGGMFVQYGNLFELVPVPEPGTWAAGSLTLAAIAFSQRRRLRFQRAMVRGSGSS